MRPYIPSLQSLLAFEAAARHLSFTRAAQELKLTQTAISHQIKSLEEKLGVKLFVRQRNALILTAAAREYLHSVIEAMGLLAIATDRTRKRKSNTVLTVTCLPTYATRCLTAALPQFQALYPDITVHLATSSTFSELDRNSYDVAIRYGSGQWPAARSDFLHGETFFPVCAPELLARIDPTLPDEEKLARLRQIRTYYYSMYQDDWPTWLAAAGHKSIEFAGESVFHLQLTSLSAAVEGGGIAIGRTPLVDGYLASGRLVAPFETKVESVSSYYVSSPQGKARLKKVELFREWALDSLRNRHQGIREPETFKFAGPVRDVAEPFATGPVEGGAEQGYRPLADLLAKHARDMPDKPALVDVETAARISYGQLALVVDGVARQLQAQGVSKGVRVLLLASEGLEKILLWLGIWRLGAVVCPLDLGMQSPKVNERICASIKPELVLLGPGEDDSGIPANVSCRRVHCHRWSQDLQTLDEPAIHLRVTDVDNTDLPEYVGFHEQAAICCTSGSTGNPKLVVYDHAAYWLNGLAAIDFLALSSADRCLEYRSFSWYSAQILSLMPMLQTGLTLCLARQFSGRHFASWVERYSVTVSVGVPAVINILLNRPELTDRAKLASLRVMSSSTSPLSTSQWIRFEQLFGVRILNFYGSSEAGWICGNRPHRNCIGTVGYAAKYAEVEIVDKHGKSCPAGQEGQVLVGGSKLALGYLQADGGIEAIRGAPYYMSDMATKDEQGFVRVSGRLDDLIIRGGVKIAPREIEEILLSHPEIADAAVIGVPDSIYGQEPVCFFVPTAVFSSEDVLAYSARNLPKEKMPKAAYACVELPRSKRGKLMRGELLKQWWSQAQQES